MSSRASLTLKHGHSRKDRLQFNLQQSNDADSSLSSLGSLPEATSVTKHFIDDLPSQRRLTTHLAASSATMQATSTAPPLRRDPSALPTRPSSSRPSRTCPHCQRRFTNAWAIPKHVSRVHDRSGELHCAKCTFKTRSKERLDAHDRAAHRTCPYCRKVFLFLDRHADTCPKRR